MKHFSGPPVCSDLLEFLERERILILSGEIERVARLLPEKERMLIAMKTSDVSQQSLERLQKAADRNQTLLGAVAQGVRAVQKRLDALQSIGSELRTYTQAGRAQNLVEKRTSMERKA